MIHIAFNIDENYISQCKVVMNSILANTNEQVHFHIIGLNHFVEYNNMVTCYGKPDISIISKETNFGHITTSACYRLFLADLLDVDKVIYLDCDLINLADIKELWSQKVKLIAGCIDPLSNMHSKRLKTSKKYINSGVLVINLKNMRKIDYKSRIIEAQKNDNISLLDQDIINIAFEKELEYIEEKWNVYSKIYDETTPEMLKARENPSIIHWCGQEKPFRNSVWNKDKWMKYDTDKTSGKAIVLTYPDLTNEEKELLKNTSIFKIACNWHSAELEPDIRLTLDNEKTIEKCLEADNKPIISANYDYPNDRVQRVFYLPNRNSSLPACVDYLVTKGYTHILLIANNKVTNNKPIEDGFARDNKEAIKGLLDCAYIYKYTDDANFDIPTMNIEEFLKMTTDENLILGISDEPKTQPLLKKLAFSDAYKYKIKTVGYDNESIEYGTLLNNLLNNEAKQRIINGEETIIYNGLEITRITGVKPVEENSLEKCAEKTENSLEKVEVNNIGMSYFDMKKFVKEHNIPTVSMTKKDLEQAIKDYKGE